MLTIVVISLVCLGMWFLLGIIPWGVLTFGFIVFCAGIKGTLIDSSFSELWAPPCLFMGFVIMGAAGAKLIWF